MDLQQKQRAVNPNQESVKSINLLLSKYLPEEQDVEGEEDIFICVFYTLHTFLYN